MWFLPQKDGGLVGGSAWDDEPRYCGLHNLAFALKQWKIYKFVMLTV